MANFFSKIEIFFNINLNLIDCQQIITVNNLNIKPDLEIENKKKCIFTFTNFFDGLKISLNDTYLKNNIIKITFDKLIRLDNKGYQFANLPNLDEIVIYPENFIGVYNTEGIFFNTKIIPENLSDLLIETCNLNMGFKNCKSNQKINLSNLNNLLFMNSCFENSSFSEILVSNLPNIKCIKYMFNNCKAKKITCKYLNISNLISLEGIFKDCFNLEFLSMNNWDTTNINNMSYLFYNTPNIKNRISFKKWNTKNVINMTAMFKKSSLNSNLIYFDMSSIQITRNMLSESKYLNGSNFINPSNVELINSNLWSNNKTHLFELDSLTKIQKWINFWNDNDLFIQIFFNKPIVKSELFLFLEFENKGNNNKLFSSSNDLNLIFKEQMYNKPLSIWKIYNLFLFNIYTINIRYVLEDLNVMIDQIYYNKNLKINIDENIEINYLSTF